jgi:transcriptional regulator with XRE-family HTH domain
MKDSLSQQEIGQRIAQLRRQKGWSQEDLARNIGLSRSALAQVELGNRSIDAMELRKLSVELGFSMDAFMSKSFSVVSEDADLASEKKVTRPEERISVPKLQVEKFKQVLLYILERCAGKPNVGETVLYKLLYFSDFNYYELYEEHLTGAKYKKLPYGPVPQRLSAILNQMITDNELEKFQTDYHGYTQTRYLPKAKPDLTQLKASEKQVIDLVLQQMSDWTATSISEYSHKDMPWLATEEGKDIDYELAFYRELPYSVRVYDEIDE